MCSYQELTNSRKETFNRMLYCSKMYGYKWPVRLQCRINVHSDYNIFGLLFVVKYQKAINIFEWKITYVFFTYMLYFRLNIGVHLRSLFPLLLWCMARTQLTFLQAYRTCYTLINVYIRRLRKQDYQVSFICLCSCLSVGFLSRNIYHFRQLSFN